MIATRDDLLIGENSLSQTIADQMDGTGYLFPQRGYMRGLGDVASDSAPAFDWNSILTNLTALWQTNQQMELQSQVNQINLARAQQGLPPIVFDTSTASPTVRVAVAPDSATKNMIYIAAAGIAIYLLLQEIRKSRKRK